VRVLDRERWNFRTPSGKRDEMPTEKKPEKRSERKADYIKVVDVEIDAKMKRSRRSP
jgi:hypothetical protein